MRRGYVKVANELLAHWLGVEKVYAAVSLNGITAVYFTDPRADEVPDGAEPDEYRITITETPTDRTTTLESLHD